MNNDPNNPHRTIRMKPNEHQQYTPPQQPPAQQPPAQQHSQVQQIGGFQIAGIAALVVFGLMVLFFMLPMLFGSAFVFVQLVVVPVLAIIGLWQVFTWIAWKH